MAFGAFAPMPLRLGGSPEEGWTPEQHARMAADVAAAYNVEPFATLTYTKSGATVAVTGYNSRRDIGTTFAPTYVVNGTGQVTWTFPSTWTDAIGVDHDFRISHASASVHSATPIRHVMGVDPTTLYVATTDTAGASADASVTLEVWSTETRSIAHYGGALDKRPSATEGNVPYAWGWYRHYQASMGSAYTTDRTGIVHCENLADARRQAAKMRAAERLEKNSVPTTADERLAYWATVQRVPFSATDVTEDIRAACAAKAQLDSVINKSSLDATLTTLLGDYFVQTIVVDGADLDNPPDLTYWPGINPGDSVLDLGDGTWTSSWCRLIVEVTESTAPPTAPALDFLRLVNGQLMDLLDEAVPSYATYNFARIDHTNGFRCNTSEIDIDGML